MPSDPRGLRGDAPALDAWLAFQGGAPTPFTIPGHKQRLDLVGDVVAGDVPLFAGLDTMSQAHGVLAAAEARAARLWGADVCRFSVGGSTHGNQALALAVGAPGDRVIVSRTLHRSLLLGLVLAGLTPVWVRPDVDDLGMPRGIPPRALTDALALTPDAVAVFIGDPSYVGTSPTSRAWPPWLTPTAAAGRGAAREARRTAYPSSSMPRGGRTSDSTRPCPATRWLAAPTHW